MTSEWTAALPLELIQSGLLEEGRMLLFCSRRSPYARKVLIALHEHELVERTVLSIADVSLVAGPALLRAVNPIGQVPTLVTVDRAILYDSLVICDHLDLFAGQRRMLPDTAEARIEVLRRHALAQSTIDAMVAWRSERNRAEDDLRDRRRTAYLGKVARAFDLWETEVPNGGANRFDLGDVTLAAALAYCDLREVLPGWRAGRPRLAGWQAQISERPSVRNTAFANIEFGAEPAPFAHQS